MNAFGRIMEIIVTVVLLFLIPFQYMQTRKAMLVESYIATETTYFVDSMRNLGYVTKNMYETYQKKLSETGNAFDVAIEYYKLVKVYDEQKSMEKYEDTYANEFQQLGKEEILEELYEGDGSYEMHQGDYIKVVVKDLSGNRTSRMLSALLGMWTTFPGTEYGGMIRDETM